MKSIIIKNTKGIAEMNFVFPERPGVYLLVGPNGTGKTTLLTAIERICNPFAFARGFPSSRYGSGYDEYIDSEITYSVDGASIRFRKKVARWSSTPKKGSASFLSRFGFTSAVFIKADSKRIEASQDEIQAGTIIPADEETISTLNLILETEKFSCLKKLRVSRGRGRAPALFNIIGEGNVYYSEKRFSTGEIAILRLIESIHSVSNNSLVLLDEAEMALHPRVQTKLIHFLVQKALEKQLTIFVSTHSPTMIKAVSPENIMLLDITPENIIQIYTPCYPAMALGGVDFEESKYYDYVFFVEDEMARYFLSYFVSKYKTIETRHSSAEVAIVPVGGFYETARMAVNCGLRLFRNSKVYAFVDKDAFDNLDNKPKFSELLNLHRYIIKDLSVTPEVRYVEILQNADAELTSKFRRKMHCEINTIMQSQDYISCNADNERYLAKKRFNVFITKCVQNTGDNEIIITKELIYLLLDAAYSNGEICRLLGPVFNSH